MPAGTALHSPSRTLPSPVLIRRVPPGSHLPSALWFAPTLFWFSASDGALLTITLLGAAASVLLVLNLAPRLAIAVAGVVLQGCMAGKPGRTDFSVRRSSDHPSRTARPMPAATAAAARGRRVGWILEAKGGGGEAG